ncbi:MULTISPECIES: DUF5987 family protein [unclassified Streptomyces]|uniref:DUF5987 family protein n=1 Tax=unclassified Streptomyces TaxID=2593676 RepID=UPI00093D7A89|nr:DUF5987 family protein [Streptomyces sp. TSRI0107]OKJ81193.1 regulator [Streptomyces sp. TSRI0107]
MRLDQPAPKQDTISTLEAFADTIVPGEKRNPDDRAVAGATSGPGAVAAGALELLQNPATGLAESLEDLAHALNGHAVALAAQRAISLDPEVPPFVALSFADRTGLVTALTAPGHPERDLWVSLALFSNMAFDTGAHLHTTEAMAAGHPGLAAMGFAAPDPDGLWRFPDFSYGRPLARLHPDTTPSGSLA